MRALLAVALLVSALSRPALARYAACAPDTPAQLCHDEDDAPTPSWEQATGGHDDVVAHLARIVGEGDARRARARFDCWPGPVRRGFALLIAKVYHEGWLDNVGPLAEDPLEDALLFTPIRGPLGQLEDALHVKPQYLENSLWNGLIASLGTWNHRDWRRGWSENAVKNSSLHVGIRYDGVAEAHFEIYNPFYRNGDSVLIGLHRRWEANLDRARISRRSANHYHFLKQQGLPLAF